MINKTVDEIKALEKKANGAELGEIKKIKQALIDKEPDQILSKYDLSKYFRYYMQRSVCDLSEIKDTIKKDDKIYKILIDRHLVNVLSGAKTVIDWVKCGIESGLIFKIADYANRVGVKRAYIYKLAKQERIHFYIKSGKKYVDPLEADQILKYRQAGRDTVTTYQRNGEKNGSAQLITEDSEELPDLDENLPIRTLERYKLYEQARKLRIENDQTEKTLIKFDDAVQTIFERLRGLRNTIKSIASRSTPLLMEKSQREKEIILDQEINQALFSLVGDIDVDDEELKKKIGMILVLE